MPLLTPEERIGSLLDGKIRLDRIVGEGGMGVVYEGLQLALDRPVAVKFLRPEHSRKPETAQRFLNEARATAKLVHEHVIEVFDVGQAPDGALYLVMELLEGEPLSSRLERGALTLRETWRILGPVMSALANAHDQAIIHRDLKPENIFLHYDRSGVLQPKILDFGIAKFADPREGTKTKTGAVLGTLTHMSPEQARGKNLGPWCDVWSMGAIWFECVTGRLPYVFADEDTPGEMLFRLCSEAPPKLREVRPDVDENLAAAIDGALQHDHAKRHRNMRAFLVLLEGVLGRPHDPGDAGVTVARAVPTAAELDAVPISGQLSESAQAAIDELEHDELTNEPSETTDRVDANSIGGLDRERDGSLPPPALGLAAVAPPLAPVTPTAIAMVASATEGETREHRTTPLIKEISSEEVPLPPSSRWLVVGGALLILGAIGAGVAASRELRETRRAAAHVPVTSVSLASSPSADAGLGVAPSSAPPGTAPSGTPSVAEPSITAPGHSAPSTPSPAVDSGVVRRRPAPPRRRPPHSTGPAPTSRTLPSGARILPEDF